jgi:NADH-quinone oxidoreductase subunit A
VDQYLPILILGLLGLAFTVFSLFSSALLAPKKKPTAAKLAPYECGIVPSLEPPQRFPVRFYLVSMIFIIFDIEIVFLYPSRRSASSRSSSSPRWSSCRSSI